MSNLIRVVSDGVSAAYGFDWTWGPTRERCCTLVAKVTYALSPGVSGAAAKQEPIMLRPRLDSNGNLARPSDLVPFKQQVDVLLVGVAYPPEPSVDRSFVARFTIGPVTRSMELRGAGEQVPFPASSRNEAPPFKASSHIDSHVNGRQFQAAPVDQRCTVFPRDAPIILENLDLRQGTLTTLLAWRRPVARIDHVLLEPFALEPDTVVVDTREAICVVTYRATRTIATDLEEVLVFIELEGTSLLPSGELSPLEHSKTSEIAVPWSTALGLPFAAEPERQANHEVQVSPQRTHSGTLPGPSRLHESAPPPPLAPPRVVISVPPQSAVEASHAAADGLKTVARVANREPLRKIPRGAKAGEGERGGVEPLVLLWFDAARVDAVRAAPAFAEVAGFSNRQPIAAEMMKESAAAKAAREVTLALQHGRVIRAREVGSARSRGYDEVGLFKPPIVLALGDIVVRYDEKKSLEAAISVAGTLHGSAKNVREALAAAQAILANDWATALSLQAALQQLRDAVARAQGSSPAVFDATLRRALLERRAYRTRIVLGEERLRFDLLMEEGSAFLLYLPASQKTSLPLFEAFPARVIAELHGPQDAAESATEAFVACAFAQRVGVDVKGRGSEHSDSHRPS